MARTRGKRSGKRRILIWTAAIAGALIVALSVAAWYLGEHFEPFLREQTLDYLRGRFDADVAFGAFDVSMPIRDPIRVALRKGKGAHVRVRIDDVEVRQKGRDAHTPLLRMKRLDFQLDLSALWEKPARVNYVNIAGLEVTIPPKGERPKIAGKPDPSAAAKTVPPVEAEAEDAAEPQGPIPAAPAAALIEHVNLDGMKLVILPRDPAKEPLQFFMKTLRLESAGPGVPMRYRTVMTNAKPPGLINCAGTFGPFMAREPGESPVTGDYTFTDADLGVFRPIAGKLASSGHFEGRLNRMTVDGRADVPDFRLKSAGNAIPLKTKFHAIVDGTRGDTWLQPVQATLGSSTFVCRGGIARHKDDARKTIDFDVLVEKGRIEDFLRLTVKGTKPPLVGAAGMKFRMKIPPGPARIPDRLVLDGTFSLQDAAFTSPSVQEKIDDISRRTQGKPSATDIQGVTSDFKGAFHLQRGILALSRLLFAVPGADVLLDGSYDLNSEALDFRGVVRTRARVSQMMKSGWKRILLKPVDPIFAKDGAGAVINITITGTRSSPQFGLDKDKNTGSVRKPAARIPESQRP